MYSSSGLLKWAGAEIWNANTSTTSAWKFCNTIDLIRVPRNTISLCGVLLDHRASVWMVAKKKSIFVVHTEKVREETIQIYYLVSQFLPGL